MFVDEHDRPYIGDFDVSMSTQQRTIQFFKQTLAKGGNLAYMAPEQVGGQSASYLSDVYSLGLLFLDLFGRGEGRANAAEIVAGRAKIQIPSYIQGELRELLEGMLQADPLKRMSMSKVVSHEYFRQLSRDEGMPVVAPMYWTSSVMQGGVRIVDVSDTMKAAMQRLIDQSCVPNLVGSVQSRSGTLGYKKLTVIKVEQIENPILMRRYLTCMENLRKKQRHQAQQEEEKASIPRVSSDTDGWYGEDVRYQEQGVVNEKWLLHSTNWAIVPKISRDGFDPRLSRGNYGKGAYFAENADKADQYSETDDQHNGVYPMFVARVVMGHFVMRMKKGLVRPPCVEGHFDSQIQCNHERADSLIGECQRKDRSAFGGVPYHREYLVYDLHQSYPAYIIHYKRE